ncbi:hypothetical protein LguiB_032598 [Lonicera macranthoides]
MKTIRQPKEKTVEAPKKRDARPVCTGVKRSTNRSSGKRHKPAVRCEYNKTREAPPRAFPSTATQASDQLLASLGETPKEVSTVELSTRQVHASTKIKLQLFPIDEGTRIGLEKDGHNPFLELTLGPRKKISSVVKHINTKWGSSNVALGEPMFFPYNIRLEDLATARRWTLTDTAISTGDVYSAIETPAIFRLRYGWFSNSESKNFRVPPTVVPLEACLESDGIQKGRNGTSEPTHGQGRKFEVTQEEFEKPRKGSDAIVTEKMSLDVPVDYVEEAKAEDGHAQSISLWDDCFTNLSIGGLLSEASLQGKNNSNRESAPIVCKLGDKGLTQMLSSWDDSFTTLSIGGLLSEASLQGKINYSDQKSNVSRSGPLISDSLDAFITKQNNSQPQAAKPLLPHDSHSSILDAEETCHAFSFRKFSFPSKDAAPSLNSYKFPNFSELNKQAGLALDPTFQESKNEILPRSRVFGEDNSLGLTGIKWNDSLGPFDLGPSTVR